MREHKRSIADPVRHRLRRLTLAQRLFIIGGTVAVVVASVVIFVTQSALRALEAQTLQDRLAATELAASSINATFLHALGEVQVTARSLSLLISDDDPLPSPGDWSQALGSRDIGMLDYVAVIDSTGQLVASQQETASIITDLSSLIPSLRLALDRPVPFVSPAFRDPRDGSTDIAITSQILSAQGGRTPFHVIGFVNNGTHIQTALDTIVRKLDTGHADLLDSRGDVFASTEATALSKGDHPTYYSAMRRSPRSNMSTVPHEEEGYPPDGYHVMAYVPLPDVPLSLAVGASEEETFAVVWAFQSNIYWLAGTVLTACLVLALIATTYFVRPVRRLAIAARQMATGDLERPVNVKDGGEIGALASSMELMRVHLHDSLNQIHQMNQELEQRIEERTAQIEHTNRELIAASSIAEKVTSFMSLDEVLDATLSGVAEATGQGAVAIFLRDNDGQRLYLRARRGLSGPLAAHAVSIGMGDCLCGRVAVTGWAEVVGDTRHSPLITRPTCPRSGFFSVAAFPLHSRERVEGVLTVFAPNPQGLTQHDFRVVDLICRQVGIAIQNARMYEGITEKERHAHQLLEKVLTAQEDERKRLARELHDETGQALTGIALALESLDTALPGHLRQQHDQIRALRTMTQTAMGELRKVALALRPSALDDLGLVPAVRRYALQYLEPLGMQVEVVGEGVDKVANASIQTILFRITQEAINNAARHSKATNVKIRFWREGSHIWGRVADDGVGFDQETWGKNSASSTSLGLLGMQERAGLAGGQVYIVSTPQQGTSVTICVPEEVGDYWNGPAKDTHPDRG